MKQQVIHKQWVQNVVTRRYQRKYHSPFLSYSYCMLFRPMKHRGSGTDGGDGGGMERRLTGVKEIVGGAALGPEGRK